MVTVVDARVEEPVATRFCVLVVVALVVVAFIVVKFPTVAKMLLNIAESALTSVAVKFETVVEPNVDEPVV